MRRRLNFRVFRVFRGSTFCLDTAQFLARQVSWQTGKPGGQERE